MPKVRLTGKAAWQMGGPTPGRTEWETVVCACSLCASFRFVAVDEVVPGYGQRHLSVGAIQGRHNPLADQHFPPPEAYSPYVPKSVSRGIRRRRS